MSAPIIVTSPRPHESPERPNTEGRKKRSSRLKRGIAGGLAAVAFTATGVGAWAVNTYVVDHVEISNVDEYEAAQSAQAATTTSESSTSDSTTASTATTTDSSWTSGDSSVTVSTVVTGSGDSTVTYYVADAVLSDATKLRSAFAQNAFGENIIEETSAIAADNNAVFAVNGDYYGFRDTGILIRNGVVYRDEGARQGLAFYADGSVQVYDETTTTADQLIADDVWNTLSFGPAIVENGAIVDGIESVEIDTNVGNHSIQGNQPRTAVGVIDDNHLVFVVVDGRSSGYSEGVTMNELAAIMTNLGVTTAYNLDGGGSSTMYFNGEVVNNPLGRGEERGVSDILYIEG